jgi:hypothetical protein
VQSDKPIRLKKIHEPIVARTIIDQKDATVPIFEGEETTHPDCKCGGCGNTLATGTMIEARPDGVRWFPPALGGEVSHLSMAEPGHDYIKSVGGPLIVRCASCKSFNEFVEESDSL